MHTWNTSDKQYLEMKCIHENGGGWVIKMKKNIFRLLFDVKQKLLCAESSVRKMVQMETTS